MHVLEPGVIIGVVSLWELRGTQCHISITLLAYGTGLRVVSTRGL